MDIIYLSINISIGLTLTSFCSKVQGSHAIFRQDVDVDEIRCEQNLPKISSLTFIIVILILGFVYEIKYSHDFLSTKKKEKLLSADLPNPLFLILLPSCNS